MLAHTKSCLVRNMLFGVLTMLSTVTTSINTGKMQDASEFLQITAETASRVEHLVRISYDQSANIRAISWSSDSTVLAVAGGAGVKLYQAPEYDQYEELYSASVYNMDINPSIPQVAFAATRNSSSLGNVHIRSITDGSERILPSDYTIVHLKYSPDGSMLATTHGGVVTLWDASNWLQVATLNSNSDNDVIDMAFTADGNYLVTVHREGQMYWWNTVDTNMSSDIIIPSDQSPFTIRLAFSRDNLYLATIELLSPIESASVISLRQIGLSASGSDEQLSILETNDVISTSGTNALIFSADGRLLITADVRPQLRFIDIETNVTLHTLEVGQDSIALLAVNGAGALLAGAEDSRFVHLWGVPST
ncbi:MAG: WD40 repeat domain-containing protein [Chloroflexota bacterium]|nr:WD40 repeat domain-containing protein [Chloroflexota bacterium]